MGSVHILTIVITIANAIVIAIVQLTSSVNEPLRSIHTCDLLGVNYCVNFPRHAIAKNGYTAHY